MELYEAMSTLRAVRRLKPDPIPEDVLNRVLTAATWAPTGGNHQAWRIIAVQNSAKKRALAELYQPHWASYVPQYEAALANAPKDVAERSRRTFKAGTYLAENLQHVPVICVFCFTLHGITITDQDLARPSVVGGGSIYPAVQNLLLAARNENLGCVLTTLLCVEEPAVKDILGLPEDWYTAAAVPLGYPVATGHGAITRKPLDKMVFRDQFGDAWDSFGK